MSGIDKEFDYLVPDKMTLGVGDKVRIVLHGRRVGGWVVALSTEPSSGLDVSKIAPVVSRSGASVAPDVVEMSGWIARRWFGPRRAVLASASAPRLRSTPVHPRRGKSGSVASTGDVAAAMIDFARGPGRSGGLLSLSVTPLEPVLPGVLALAASGSVLVVCPTMRMAALGAAWLRRRGAQVATLPDDWGAAVAGVDVVIGARSAVLAPCAGLAAIVVVDAHDESLKEERSPAWDALSVARERGRRLGVPVVATSPVPPADPVEAVRVVGSGAAGASRGWGRIVVEDLNELPVGGSLLGGSLLGAVRDPGGGVLCILNTKGAARLIACRSCRALQRCALCRSALSRGEHEMSCVRCAVEVGSVCVECGSTSVHTVRAGTAGLLADIERSTGVVGVEVTAETGVEDLVGRVFVGTESLLNRVSHADTVVFCDIDRDLGAPRVTAPREVLASVAKAVRIAGADGSVVLQSRDPAHPVFGALTAVDAGSAVASFLADDVASRRTLGLPPFSRVVRLAGVENFDPVSISSIPGIDHRTGDGVLVLRGDDDALVAAVSIVAGANRGKVRVHADPFRF